MSARPCMHADCMDNDGRRGHHARGHLQRVCNTSVCRAPRILWVGLQKASDVMGDKEASDVMGSREDKTEALEHEVSVMPKS